MSRSCSRRAASDRATRCFERTTDLLEGVDRIFQYHFEFLTLGYEAYLVFYERCRAAFPDVSDQTIAKMLSGIDVLVLRPDDELRRLARFALDLDLGRDNQGLEQRGRARGRPRGERGG